MVRLEILIFFLSLLPFPIALLFSAHAGAFLAPLQFDHIFREASHLKFSLSAVQETTSKAMYLR